MGKNSDQTIGKIMFEIHLNCYVKVLFFLLIRPNLPENKGREKKRYPMKMVRNFYDCYQGFFQSYLYNHFYLIKSFFSPFAVTQEAEWRARWRVREHKYLDGQKTTSIMCFTPLLHFFYHFPKRIIFHSCSKVWIFFLEFLHISCEFL